MSKIFRVSLLTVIIIYIFNLYVYAEQIEKFEFYMRYMSPERANLLYCDKEYHADKFFKALKSDNIYEQYIAINKLVECFNDSSLRKRAIEQIKPFIQNDEPKLAESALFVTEILSQNYDSENIYKLDDGSIFFTIFNDYSDYGSYNEIWKIKDGRLSKYYSFEMPSMYITEIIPSPDRKLLAVATCSNKSNFITVFDPVNGFISPELVGSSRAISASQRGYDAWIREDGENYCSVSNINWQSNQQISFDAQLSYDNTNKVENISVIYNFNKKKFDISLRQRG